MDIRIHSQSDEHPERAEFAVKMDGDEVALMYHALEEYAKNLHTTIKQANEVDPEFHSQKATRFEDETFCYGVLAEISKLRYDLVENYNHLDAEQRRTQGLVKRICNL